MSPLPAASRRVYHVAAEFLDATHVELRGDVPLLGIVKSAVSDQVEDLIYRINVVPSGVDRWMSKFLSSC